MLEKEKLAAEVRASLDKVRSAARADSLGLHDHAEREMDDAAKMLTETLHSRLYYRHP